MCQGHLQHLPKDVSEIEESKKANWTRIDAYLCSLLWQAIDPSLMAVFRPYKTCKGVWARVHEMYIRDVTRVYDVLSSLFQLKLTDTDMQTHLARLQALFTEFDEIMPCTTDLKAQDQCDKMKMVICLQSLGVIMNLSELRSLVENQYLH